MNRAVLVLPIVPLAAACGVDCGDPTQINGTYAIFANVQDYDGTNLENFPSYGSPANGFSEWKIDWDRVANQVNLTIDNYPFTADGTWDPIQCGDFTLDFAGPYTDTAGVSHNLSVTNGSFVVFADSINGEWDYDETWTDLDGNSGTFTTHGLLGGKIIAAE